MVQPQSMLKVADNSGARDNFISSLKVHVFPPYLGNYNTSLASDTIFIKSLSRND